MKWTTLQSEPIESFTQKNWGGTGFNQIHKGAFEKGETNFIIPQFFLDVPILYLNMTTKAFGLYLQCTVAVCLLVETLSAYLKTHELKFICHFENLRFISTSRKGAYDAFFGPSYKFAYLVRGSRVLPTTNSVPDEHSYNPWRQRILASCTKCLIRVRLKGAASSIVNIKSKKRLKPKAHSHSSQSVTCAFPKENNSQVSCMSFIYKAQGTIQQ